MPFDVLAISGSLRRNSSNTGLVHMAKRLSEQLDGKLTIEIDDSIGSLPFYNADLEDPSQTPDVVLAWRDRVSACDALFIASPEYNFGTTAVLKNAVDWATRPPGQHALRGKVISLMSSSSSTGGKNTIEQYTNMLTLLGNTMINAPDGAIIKGAERISEDGSTTDPAIEVAVLGRLQAIVSVLQS
jgi:chromate reductase